MNCSSTLFQVFGYVAYACVRKELRRKLNEKCEKYIFIGYSDHSKTHKLCNMVIKKLIIDANVEFK